MSASRNDIIFVTIDEDAVDRLDNRRTRAVARSAGVAVVNVDGMLRVIALEPEGVLADATDPIA